MKKIKFLSLAVLSLMFAAAFQFAMAEDATTVDIDIKPNATENRIKLSSSSPVPVLILTSDSYDVEAINAESVTLGGVSAFESDLSYDLEGNLLGLLLRFKADELDLVEGYNNLTLTGRMAVGSETVEITGNDFLWGF